MALLEWSLTNANQARGPGVQEHSAPQVSTLIVGEVDLRKTLHQRSRIIDNGSQRKCKLGTR
eukprot:2616422-Amphidinium_carterae.1